MKTFPKSILISNENLQNNSVPFIIHGQGVMLFNTEKNIESCKMNIQDNDNINQLSIEITKNNTKIINLTTKEEYIDLNNDSGLIDTPGSFYWFSLDSQNQILRIGIGEARLETLIYEYKFSHKDNYEENKVFLESLMYIEYESVIIPFKLLRDPIVSHVPLCVKDTDGLTMDYIAQNKYLPHSNLSPISQILYNCISGNRFVLDDRDFPEFSKAIEYSISTPGCWCYETLKSKSKEFNPTHPNIDETYLRITLGKNSGESPGIPYVLEIWPPNHYSPVHSHASTDAIIRVLHGEINVQLFPYLSPQKIEPFGESTFKKDDITWLSPQLNQIHQLKNLNQTTTCITIQCYMYGKDNKIHYDYFDYVSEDEKIEQYEPDSDKDFVEFKELMKEEWENRVQENCFYKLFMCKR